MTLQLTTNFQHERTSLRNVMKRLFGQTGLLLLQASILPMKVKSGRLDTLRRISEAGELLSVSIGVVDDNSFSITT